MKFYEEVKKGLIRALKQVKDIDVFFTTNEDTEASEEFFFVSIKPALHKSESVNLYGISCVVSIAYNAPNLSPFDYLIFAESLDMAFSPTLCFDTFSVLVREREFKVIDSMLHFTFAFSITYEVKEETDIPLMGELVIRK